MVFPPALREAQSKRPKQSSSRPTKAPQLPGGGDTGRPHYHANGPVTVIDRHRHKGGGTSHQHSGGFVRYGLTRSSLRKRLFR